MIDSIGIERRKERKTYLLTHVPTTILCVKTQMEYLVVRSRVE